MPSFTLLTLTLGSLGSLLLQDVSGFRMPLVSDNELHMLRARQYSESSNESPRSVEMGELTLKVVPTSGRASTPAIIRLRPVSAKPSHLHANLPLRFGRETPSGDRTPKSSVNLPQRFGRDSYGSLGGSAYLQPCAECLRSGSPPSATLPQRFGRRSSLSQEPLRGCAIFGPTRETSVPNNRSRDQTYMSKSVEDAEEVLTIQK